MPDLPGRVVLNGRLGPGRMIAVDLMKQRLLMDEEIKQEIAGNPVYSEWCA